MACVNVLAIIRIEKEILDILIFMRVYGVNTENVFLIIHIFCTIDGILVKLRNFIFLTAFN